jgi:hypothetical protein
VGNVIQIGPGKRAAADWRESAVLRTYVVQAGAEAVVGAGSVEAVGPGQEPTLELVVID